MTAVERVFIDNMPNNWFPLGRNNGEGWRLDIVSLLAVIGESSMEEHSQALTSSWTALLPRIIPAPQALLKPARPTRMPQVNAAVVGVHNGTLVPTLNYFPNIIHPIEELPAFAFQVLKIKHRGQPDPEDVGPIAANRIKETSTSTSVDIREIETGPVHIPQRRSTFRKITRTFTANPDKPRPRIPSRTFSPLNVLSIGSFFLTLGLLIWAGMIGDGTAMVALGTISLASSIVGYASWWSPVLKERNFNYKVPPGDVVIRTREGAFLVVKCNEDIARELYTGTEECMYYVKTQPYRLLVGFGTFLLMISVVLLGNCNFVMQAAIGVSYILLNGAFWVASVIDKDKFWDLSLYEWDDITPKDAKNAHLKDPNDKTVGGKPSFTRTLWYAIRETKKIGWVRRGGAAPRTPQWEEWLRQAEENAAAGVRNWNAVEMREEIVGQTDKEEQAKKAHIEDSAEQHAPAIEVPPPSTK